MNTVGALFFVVHSSASLSIAFASESPRPPREQIWDINRTTMEDEMHIWEDRRCVSAVIEVDSLGAIVDATVLETHATAQQTDSVLAVIRSWRLEPAHPLQGMPRSRTETIVVAVQRTGCVQGAKKQLLPGLLQRMLRAAPFQDWTEALTSVHPEAFADYFRSYGALWLYDMPSKNALAEPQLKSKRACGMLLDSPDGAYVLDPFVGYEVDDNCRLMSDVDHGFALFETASGNQTFGDVGWNWVDVSGWLDESTFVMAGKTRLEHPAGSFRAVGATFPMVWFADAQTGLFRRFIGAPLDPMQQRELGIKWAQMRRRLYPSLQAD